MLTMEQIGEACARARREHGVTQLQVAFDMHYCPTNITEFEKGRNNNAILLLYYIRNFFSIGQVYDLLRFEQIGGMENDVR